MRKPKTAESLKTLAEKLCRIRSWKQMSQSDIISVVYPEVDESQRSLVSQWENANREPGRQILIRYARLARISLDQLLIDEIDLPAHIAGDRRHPNGGFRKDTDTKSEADFVKGNEAGGDDEDDKNDEETDDKLTVQANESNESNKPQFLEIPFGVGSALTEAITVNLPVDLLDELDEVYFELLRETPRRLRSKVTIENIIGFSTKAILYQHTKINDGSLLAQQVESLISYYD